MPIATKSAQQIIEELNITDETEGLEAKSISGSDLGNSVFETICAMCNEPGLEGGTILLGVSKDDGLFPLYSATGILDADKISTDVASGCTSLFNIPVRVDIKTETISGQNVVRIDVPEMPKHQKPVYIKKYGLPRGAYRRIGSTDIKCTEEDLAAFYQNKAHDTYDYLTVEEADLDDLDPRAIELYRKARREVNPHAEELNWSDNDLLLALGALRNVSGSLKVTTTGLIVFGKGATIRRIFPSLRVDYVRVPGTTWMSDPSAQFESTDMRGSIMTLISRVIAAIVDDLPKSLKIENEKSGQRQEIPAIPLRVIREAVVNALMHRSYQPSQPVQVIRYANRIVIKNPGYSLKSQERFSDPGSLIRNPHIAEVLHETRFAETKGSGIRVMQQKMSENGLSPPTFISDRDNDEFEAIFLFHHFMNEQDWKWLSAFKGMDLTDDQKRALIFVREVGAIDNASYRNLTQVDTMASSRSLRRLRSLDLLEDRGSGARTHYVAGPALLAELNMDAPPHVDELSMDAKGHDIFFDLPQALKVRVKNAQLSKRADPEKTRDLIVSLCKWQPLSAAELSDLLQKTQSYVSQKFLAPMVSEGVLRYQYPEMIQHPQQKYVA